MKTLKYMLLAAITTVGLGSCDSLLEENPNYSQSDNVVFSTAANAEIALMGCYSYLAANAAYGQMWQEMPIVASGLTWAQRSGGDNSIGQLATLPRNTFTSAAWNGMYKAATECNAFIASMEKSALPDSVKTQHIGEAKFIRALAYYNLASVFGAVPLKLVASTSDGISSTRTPLNEVFSQVIKDLEAAALTKETSADGRANAWAAKAMLGKVYYKLAMLDYHCEENLQQAKKYFDEVYNAKKYKLSDSFAKLFQGWVTKSPESIFQVNFIPNSSSNAYNRGSNRFSPNASTSGINWGTYRVLQYAYDLQNGIYPNDPRLEVNYLSKWRSRSGNNQVNPRPQVGKTLCANDSSYCYPYATYTSKTDTVVGSKKVYQTKVVKVPYELFDDPTCPQMDKLLSYKNSNALLQATINGMPNLFSKVGNGVQWCYYGKMYAQDQTGTQAPKNLMVYRYAEMLLLMADVYNELGQTARAIEIANEVIARARNSVKGATYPQNWASSLSQDQVREKLYFERIFELSGEPNIFDMVRIRGTKLFGKLLSYNNRHGFAMRSDSLYTASPNNAFASYVFNNGDLSEDFLKKNLLLPIPAAEIDANPGLKVESQNYGY